MILCHFVGVCVSHLDGKLRGRKGDANVVYVVIYLDTEIGLGSNACRDSTPLQRGSRDWDRKLAFWSACCCCCCCCCFDVVEMKLKSCARFAKWGRPNANLARTKVLPTVQNKTSYK